MSADAAWANAIPLRAYRSDVKARGHIMLERSRAHETTRLRAPGMVDALLAACPAGRVRIRDDMPVLYAGPEFLPRRAAL